MSVVKTVGLRSARVWASVCVVIACLMSPTAAAAQAVLHWTDDGAGFASFGPNAAVTISYGEGTNGTCDFIIPATDIYVVNVSSLANGAKLVDVNNTPNTVQLASGGLFISETIAFTQPGGNLGAGIYGVVYDECQNGKFDAGVDTLFYPAFEVVIPANIPILPDASIQAIKTTAKEEADSWAFLVAAVEAVELMIKIKETLECLSGGLGGCLASMAIGALQDYLIEQARELLGLVDPKEAAKDAVVDTIAHYNGIHADPPDPNFAQLDALEPVTHIPQTSTDPLVNQIIAVGNAQRTQAVTLEALLHAVERYQGADIAGNADWALVHARSIQALSNTLRSQMSDSTAALTAFDAVLTADPRDFNQGVQAAPLIAQIINSGFQPSQVQSLLNAGLPQNQLAALRAHVAAYPWIGVSEAEMHSSIAAVQAANVAFDAALASLSTEMTSVINTLLAPPNVTSGFPLADAGGPYTGNEGAALALNGNASSDPGGSIIAYHWDLDRDGQFDDASGATPSFVFPAAFNGLIGLRVLDNSGNASIDYAHVAVGETNLPPVIDAVTPSDQTLTVPVGDSQTFSVVATDPEGAALSVRWLVDFVEVETGQATSYQHTFDTVGTRIIRVEVSDGSASGGMVADEWMVTAEAPDADGDGWRANADCNDANPAINPGAAEIIGNGIDDDCRADTQDGGTPPTASFTVPTGVKVVGQPVAFTDTSQDPDGPLASWAWNFGDGQTSNQQSPSHVFATAGTFKVVLTVFDGQGLTSTVEHAVTATNLPTAAFTYAPNPGVRNAPIQFTDTSVDVDGPIASRSWQFGDGGISSDANPVHTFTSAGTFTVTLTVTDGHGATAVATQAVVVNPALTDTTSVSFKIRHGCSTVTSYRFKVGGVLAGTLPPFTQTGCTTSAPVEQTLTVSDPAVLAQITAPVCQVFTLESTGSSAIGWSRVEIGRPGGTEIVRIMNTNQFDVPTAYSAYAAGTGAQGNARTFNSVLPNKDGDATPDCSDPDIDNDGRLNGVDNCPLISNATQADGDANGIGDACQDTDADTILDSADNCPAVANTNQFNFDNDGAGNACDDDIDADGVDNAIDNCQYISNADQANANGDAFGDVCDVAQLRVVMMRSNQQFATKLTMSIDGKTVGSVAPAAVPDMNCTNPPASVLTVTDPELLGLLGAVPTCNAFRITSDNIHRTSWSRAEIQRRSGTINSVVIHDLSAGAFNASACRTANTNPTFYQNATPDFDKDGIFDCEDPDTDGDKVLNTADNCPLVANSDQADIDGNGIGNACQDTDNDTVLDINDNCPVTANTNQANLDGDSQGDVCDADRDNDTVLNTVDNCPNNANTNQSNIDGDSLGDVCDTDMDADGDLNTADNCPTVPNADQRNTDGDAQGDACDADLDNDGIANAVDNCLYVANASQQSTNPYGVGNACIVAPITVPWLGVATQPHQVYSGGSLVLQGVAVYEGSFLPVDILSASWDPGDGSAVKPVVSVANARVLEVTHTYTGAVNTPYRAILTITMLNGATRSDEFRVIIQPKTLDVEANMAIDRGLWNLHKSMTANTVGTPAIPAGFWTGGDNVAATSATVQAFGINNHREVGNRMEDPYVDDVTRGLRYLENALTPANITVQAAGNPDTNGNGIGLQYSTQPIYVTGQIADAFVAMGTPNALAVGGHATRVKGRRYLDLVQDMMDLYWFGQTDTGAGRGGWRYSLNGGADNSTAQWGAITGLAGENAWNIPVPAFVKTENLIWLKASQDMTNTAAKGRLGYTNSACAWSNCMSTTPSGMVQMNFAGVRNDPAATSDNEQRFQLALRYMAKGMRNAWHTSEYATAANYYSLFAMAKAFRLAVDTDGAGNLVPDPVVMIDDVDGDASLPFDWYRNDPVTPTAASPRGVARLLISKQTTGGNWPDAGSWPGSLATAYSVIVLSPTIFELGPAAACSATPTVAGAGDTVNFDGSASVHNDPFGTITSYKWDFLDGSPVVINAAPNATASHTFTGLSTFNVLLTVTDQNGLTASSSCPVTVIDGNRPPIANAGGPYNFCAGSPMVLDASASVDPDGDPLSFLWDLTNPLNFTNPEGTTALFNATSKLSTLTPGTYQIGLRVSDNHAHSTSVFPNITIHPADNPLHCNTPPVLTLPANITTPATSSAGAEVDFEVTATDAQDGALTPACTAVSGATFVLGETTVECSVKDSGGLTDTGSFTVTVTNNGPQFTPPEDITVPATSAAGAAVTFTATGTDIENGTIDAVCVPASGSTFAIATTQVNCTVSDGQLTASGSFTVTVTNNTPTFTPPADITVAATSAAGAVVTFVASGSDIEDGPIAAACTRPSGDTFALGTTTLLCSVTDRHGESVSGSFTILVTNNPPTFTPPADIAKAATSPAGAVVTFTATGSDIESGSIDAVCLPASGSTFGIGTTPVHCTVTDGSGLTAEGSFNVTVTNTAPTFTPPQNITRPATSPDGAVVEFTAQGNDSEDGPIDAVCVPASGSTFTIAPHQVTCTVTDVAGATASGSFNVTVTNNPPTFTPPADITTPATSPAGAVVTFTATGSDVEDGPLDATCVPASGSTFAIGSRSVECTITDIAGATATGSFTVTVTNTAPTFTPPQDITTPATSPAGAVVRFTATGNDSEDGPLDAVCVPTSGSTFAIATHQVTCTVTDVAGATASGSFNVTVTNNAPTFTPPADITKPATSAAGAVVTFTATGSDVEDGPLDATCVPASGSTFAIGSRTVECTVTDIAGAPATGSFRVTVTNNAPAFTPPADITVEAAGHAGLRVNFSASGSDLEDGVIPAVCAPASGGLFAIGSTPVGCTVTDSAGVGAKGSFRIHVVDTTPPQFTVANLVMHATSATGAVVPFAFTATDTVDGIVPVACAPVGGSTFPIGVTPVRCTATDAHNNTTTRDFTVTVFNTAPTCEAQPSVSSLWPPNHKWVPVTITGGRDADGDPVQLTIDSIFQDEPINGIADGDTAPDGSGLGTNKANVRAERAGSPKVPGNGRMYYINFTGNDGRGGLCTGTVTVGVPHDQSPERDTAIGDGPLFNSVTGARQQ